MGYCATGYGQFRGSFEKNLKAIIDILVEIEETCGEDIETHLTSDTKGDVICITQHYGRYYEEDYCKQLSRLAKLGIEGEMEFAGDDDCFWQIVVTNGNVYICEGHIVFDEPLNNRNLYIPAEEEE